MKTLQSLKKTIQSAKDLHSVVRTMKSLAAVNIRQYEEAEKSAEEYDTIIDMALRIILINEPRLVNMSDELGKSYGIIIIGSDQGMSGRFNEEIASFSKEKIGELSIKNNDVQIIAIGSRVAALLSEEFRNLNRDIELPGSVKGIERSVQDTLSIVEEWRIKRNLKNILIFYNERLEGSNYKPRKTRLLPLDKNRLQSISKSEWNSRTYPSVPTNFEDTLYAIISEYLFASLFRAFAESLAAENAGRLAAMQAAEKNISERLDDLNARYNRLRQTSITSELLDIASGYEALSQ